MAVRFFTKNEARAAARAVVRKTATESLREAKASVTDSQSFDVFLSHAIADAELVLGVKLLLEARGLAVYVDWDTDATLDRTLVTPKTAAVLRGRMNQSKSLLYLATDAATSSKWMPWELGYFDGMRSGGVAVMPLVERETDTFAGQEYLGLYPRVTKDTYRNTNQEEVFVEDSVRWTTLKEFNAGTPRWRTN